MKINNDADFKFEHKHLVKVLKFGSKSQKLAEAEKQEKELKAK